MHRSDAYQLTPRRHSFNAALAVKHRRQHADTSMHCSMEPPEIWLSEAQRHIAAATCLRHCTCSQHKLQHTVVGVQGSIRASPMHRSDAYQLTPRRHIFSAALAVKHRRQQADTSMHCSVGSPEIWLSETQRRIADAHALGIARAVSTNCSTQWCAYRARSEHLRCIAVTLTSSHRDGIASTLHLQSSTHGSMQTRACTAQSDLLRSGSAGHSAASRKRMPSASHVQSTQTAAHSSVRTGLDQSISIRRSTFAVASSTVMLSWPEREQRAAALGPSRFIARDRSDDPHSRWHHQQ